MLLTWMIVGGAVVVITMVVVGCLRTGGGRLAIPDGAGADDVTVARMGEGTGVALASRCEKAAGGRVIWVRMGGLLGLFFRRHSSQAAT